jgi:hypothetical protein
MFVILFKVEIFSAKKWQVKVTLVSGASLYYLKMSVVVRYIDDVKTELCCTKYIQQIR